MNIGRWYQQIVGMKQSVDQLLTLSLVDSWAGNTGALAGAVEEAYGEEPLAGAAPGLVLSPLSGAGRWLPKRAYDENLRSVGGQSGHACIYRGGKLSRTWWSDNFRSLAGIGSVNIYMAEALLKDRK